MNIIEMEKLIKKHEEGIRKSQEEVRQLRDKIRKMKKSIRAEEGEYYYTIQFYSNGTEARRTTEDYLDIDDGYYNNNNYFIEKEQADKTVQKINFLLKLKRFHDIHCPDYKPNWNDAHEEKFYIYLNGCYKVAHANERNIETNIYFDKLETAEYVCNVLNKEMDYDKN